MRAQTIGERSEPQAETSAELQITRSRWPARWMATQRPSANSRPAASPISEVASARSRCPRLRSTSHWSRCSWSRPAACASSGSSRTARPSSRHVLLRARHRYLKSSFVGSTPPRKFQRARLQPRPSVSITGAILRAAISRPEEAGNRARNVRVRHQPHLGAVCSTLLVCVMSLYFATTRTGTTFGPRGSTNSPRKVAQAWSAWRFSASYCQMS